MNVVMTSASFIEDLGLESLNLKQEGRKWNRRQIMGHLIDSASHNQLRIIRRMQHDTLLFQDYDQDFCVDINQYEIRSNAEILETFIVYQRQIANLLTGIPDEAYLKEYDMATPNAINSLSHFVYDYVAHLEHHLAQVIPGYEALAPDHFYQ